LLRELNDALSERVSIAVECIIKHAFAILSGERKADILYSRPFSAHAMVVVHDKFGVMWNFVALAENHKRLLCRTNFCPRCRKFWDNLNSVFYVLLDSCLEGTFFKGVHYYAEVNKYAKRTIFLRICILDRKTTPLYINEEKWWLNDLERKK